MKQIRSGFSRLKESKMVLKLGFSSVRKIDAENFSDFFSLS